MRNETGVQVKTGSEMGVLGQTLV